MARPRVKFHNCYNIDTDRESWRFKRSGLRSTRVAFVPRTRRSALLSRGQGCRTKQGWVPPMRRSVKKCCTAPGTR